MVRRSEVTTRAHRDTMTIRVTERWWEIVQAEARVAPHEATGIALRLLEWAATYDETARHCMDAIQGGT